MIKQFIDACNISFQELISRIEDVSYGDIDENGYETILFKFDRKVYEGTLKGPNIVYILTKNQQSNKVIAGKVILRGDYKEYHETR